VSFLAVDACIHDGFLALVEIDEKTVTKDFLFQRLNTLREQFEKSATHGGVFTNLTTSVIKEFEFDCPSPKEQTKIADFLSSLDRKIESVATQITETQTFKRGLLQQMFV
jgi:type I restriction enzyme S subunit